MKNVSLLTNQVRWASTISLSLLLFLSITSSVNAQTFGQDVYMNHLLRLGGIGGKGLSLHPNAPFEIDNPGIVGGRFKVGTDGRVGIGTNNPQSALDVKGDIASSHKIWSNEAQFSNLTFGNSVSSKITLYKAPGMNDIFGFGISPNQINYHVNTVTSDHVFYATGNNGNGTELIRIKGNGRIGIGTNNPASTLHVNGETRINGLLRAFGGAYLNDKLTVEAPMEVHEMITGNRGARIKFAPLSLDPSAAFLIDEPGIIGGRFMVRTDGNVGIGTSNPNKGKLHVKGSIHVENNVGEQVFHVSPLEQLTFIGKDAYQKWEDMGSNPNNLPYGTDYSLWVSQGIVCEDFAVSMVSQWDDYVFNTDYKLPALEDLENFVKTHKHLPSIPSETEVKQRGYSVHELNRGFLKTIEELTLYTIAQEKKIKNLEAEVAQYKTLQDDVKELKAAMTELKKR
ncbi:hypothetical protein Q4Q39_05030 [Flavivirga amylovorans]|uniref:BZIP transcription factor n=1 Tax=Flavivirga amylovorans TaxID=870486 RepID=A0ABT8WYL5_9FLAO|nr:hypothetical protein [Flavivirga amylovorans]MDO5986766.1 hypothetical protein [Flavivirga amylovorans]